MDPNETLRQIREKVEKILASEVCSDVDLNGIAIDLAQNVKDLDTWLVCSGFLPYDWTIGGTRV